MMDWLESVYIRDAAVRSFSERGSLDLSVLSKMASSKLGVRSYGDSTSMGMSRLSRSRFNELIKSSVTSANLYARYRECKQIGYEFVCRLSMGRRGERSERVV